MTHPHRPDAVDGGRSVPAADRQYRDPAEWLAQLCSDEGSPRAAQFHPFFGHRGPRGEVGPWSLSQWAPVRFVYETREFPNAEVAMMSAKARLFSDWDTLAQLLRTSDPKRAKELGRQVRGFDQHTWDAHAYRYVVDINEARFSQNPKLGEYLTATGPAILVEASPYDRIWGIGLTADDPRATRPTRWRGRNLLGFALTEVRDRLT